MKGKKLIVCIIILIIVLSCVQGCGKKQEEAAPKEPKQETESEEETEEPEKEEKDGREDLASPSVTGALHVEGTSLAGSDGQPIQLKGISTHGLAWFPDYVNEECFKELHEKWNVNVIRLAMYTAESGGYCTDGDKEYLKGLIRDGVKYALAQDMYVIIDWHILSDNNPNMNIDEAKDFFAEMSAKYAEAKHVLYEICNEPNGGTGWGEIKSYAEEVIGVIRENDSDAVILIGTPNWSQFVDEAAADPVTGYDNLMYTLHFYAATHTDDLRARLSSAVDAGLPVFVSEYGICDASGNGAIDEVQADLWTELLDSLGISYVAWNLSNKEETSAIFKSSCSKTSGFLEEDISDSGKWLYRMLTGGKASGAKNGENSGIGETGAADMQESTQVLPSQNEAVIESGDIKVTARVKNSWEADGKKFYQYDLILTNTSDKECNGWAIDIPFQSRVALSDGWNGNYAAEGTVLHITSKEYNGVIPPEGALLDVGFIVSGGDGIKK